jgi:hypothetical protein
MNAQPKQPTVPYFNGSFDARLRQALNKAKIPHVERVKLYQAIVDVCTEHVQDCCDSVTAALYLALHDDHGFGQKRINRVQERTQDTIDSYVAKYDIGTITALYRDLRARKIIIKPR